VARAARAASHRALSVIEVRIRKRLGRGGMEIDAEFVSEARGVTALFGRSGAGKTTILNAVAGLVRPDSGLIRVGGQTFFDCGLASGRRLDLPAERRRVGYVFQDARLFPHLGVLGNLTYGLRRAAPGDRRVALGPVVETLGLGGLLDRRPHHLSGGERQRVALGRAILAQPRLLLLDEPLASLDAERKAEIIPYVERLRDEFGIPMLLVSHALDEVVRLAATLVLVDRGRAVAAGPLADVLSRPEAAALALPGLAAQPGEGAPWSILRARVEAHEERWSLTTLSFPGGALRVPRVPAPVGSFLPVRLRARGLFPAAPDSLPCGPVPCADDLLPALVRGLSAAEGPFLEVGLDLGGAALAARVTRLAADRLALSPGTPVRVLVEAEALGLGAPAAQPPRP
jgi:molybdate transport system ATP-binding protein